MLIFNRSRQGVLRNEAAEHEIQGAGNAPAAAAEEPRKPGVIEQAMAGLRSKAALNTEIAQLKGTVESQAARIQELETQAAELSGKVVKFTADHAALEQALTEAAEEKQSVDEAAAAKLAAVGIAPTQLPPAGQDAQDTADSLRDKLKVEKDPKERFRLQQRIDALEA
jgi:predicted nuclease with TOPRIM domain